MREDRAAKLERHPQHQYQHKLTGGLGLSSLFSESLSSLSSLSASYDMNEHYFQHCGAGEKIESFDV